MIARSIVEMVDAHPGMFAPQSGDPRFWARVRKSDGCWEWTGYVADTGYGRFLSVGKNYALAHRYSWELVNGPIPAGHHVHHKRRNRRCVNPDHLEAVSPREHVFVDDSTNIMAAKAKQTHCKRGHAFDEANTSYDRNGRSRRCLACQRANSNRRYALVGRFKRLERLGRSA